MEPTGLRDVFKCITLSIAAMEDIGLLPKPGADPPAHRPAVTETPGPHRFPSDPPRRVSEARRKSDEDGPSKKRFFQPAPTVPLQNPSPLGPDTAIINTADQNGSRGADEAGAPRKTPKAKVADPSQWKQNQQKQLRMEGKAYLSRRKKDGEIVAKRPRAMGAPCASDACRKASNRLCGEIGEDARRKAFEEFWLRMNWAQRKLYVAAQVDRDPVERSRAAGPRSRRSASLRYHLMVDGERKQVCKNTFLSTLGIGEWSVLNWTQKEATGTGGSNGSVLEKTPNPVPALRTSEDAKEEKNGASEPEGPDRKKSRAAKPLTWKQNRQKQLRMEGKPYVSRQKKDGSSVTKAQRTMGSRCTSSACKRASNRFCADFSEETRGDLFAGFWQCMNWAQRRIYVAGLVDRDPVERTRAPWTQSRRSVSMRYHLMADGVRKQVCKKMFLSTLGVGEWSVLSWAQSATRQADSEENAKKQTGRKSRKASEHVFLKEFLESLPKAPSYGRGASISELHPEPVFSNMSEAYRHYHRRCVEKKAAPLSRQVFCAVFKKMNLSNP